MVVPFGNYQAFHDALPNGENSIYRINDTYAETDHMTAAVIFFAGLCGTGSFVDDYQWISEPLAPTGIDTMRLTGVPANDDNWYTLDGRCLSSKPTTKGVYIHQRKKVVIK